jgi:hypothetical protein
MNRIEAMTGIREFLREHGTKFAALPRDAAGRLDTTEIRKLLAVDAELSIALAGLLAVIWLSVEHEARAEAATAFTGRS